MNNYEQEANVILKMTKVVHPDYVVNSIAQFLKERDTKQKLNIHSVMQAEGLDGAKGAAVASEGQGEANTCADWKVKCHRCGKGFEKVTQLWSHLDRCRA